jgi:hypothetical protein
LLVIKRAFFTPHKGNDWHHNNIFQSTCTVGFKICKLVIDLGRCEIIIFEEVVKKLGLETEKHPSPYNLARNKKETK